MASRFDPSSAGTRHAIGAAGNPWDDLQGAPAVGNASAALTSQALRDTSWLGLHFRHDQQDALHFAYQLPHGWEVGSSVRPHLHVVPMGAGAGNVRFAGQYAWVPFGGSVPAVADWTSFTADLAISADQAFHHLIAPLFTAVPPAAAHESAILLVYVYRDGTNVADTYTTSNDGGTAAANLAVLSSDLHYQREKVGTADEIPS